MRVLSVIGDRPYNIVLLLHILAVIVGLGGVMLNGVYGTASRKTAGRGATALVVANEKATKIAEFFIYAIPLLGFALVGMSNDAFGFDQTWVWLSVVLFLVALGLSLGLLLPASRRFGRTIIDLEAGRLAPSPEVDATLDGA